MTGRRADEGGQREDSASSGVDGSSPNDADSPTATPSGDELTHVDRAGRVRMVDVGGKDVTERQAVARAELRMQPETLRLLLEGRGPKGDVLATARVAGIQAAKRTSELLPLCHHVALATCEIAFDPIEQQGALLVETRVRARDRTGVEMEALTAASVAALTVYDMLKAVDRGMTIEGVRLEEKQGGRSGHWRR